MVDGDGREEEPDGRGPAAPTYVADRLVRLPTARPQARDRVAEPRGDLGREPGKVATDRVQQRRPIAQAVGAVRGQQQHVDEHVDGPIVKRRRAAAAVRDIAQLGYRARAVDSPEAVAAVSQMILHLRSQIFEKIHYLSFAYLGSRIGEASVIDPRDPTGGVAGTIAVKDINTAANCVATFAQLVTLLGGVPFGDCAALGLPAGNAVALKGNRLPNAPEWTVRVGAQFDENLSSKLALRIRADVTQRSDIWGRIFNRDPIDRLEGWGVVNGTVQLSDIDERWYLRVEGSNLFDSAGATGMFVADASSGLPTNLFLLPARRVIAVAGVRF